MVLSTIANTLNGPIFISGNENLRLVGDILENAGSLAVGRDTRQNQKVGARNV